MFNTYRKKSKRPLKELFWKYFIPDLKSIPSSADVLDLACGYSAYRDLISCESYTGVDLDEERITESKAKHPADSFVYDDITRFKADKKYDVILCVQTMGVNRYFDNDKSNEVITNILSLSKPKGAAFFNIGPRLTQETQAIKQRLTKEFEHVELRVYSAPIRQMGTNLSTLVAFVFYVAPFLQKFTTTKFYYYRCLNRHGLEGRER